MDETVRTTLARLAESNLGLIVRSRAEQEGISRQALERAVGRGELVVLSPLVLRHRAVAPSDHQRALAAVLDAGPSASLSHASAAWLWGLPGYFCAPVHVIGERRTVHRTSPYLAAVVHEPRLVAPHHVVQLAGIRVATPGRLLFDLAGDPAVHPKRLERTLDTAWARNLVNQRSLQRLLVELAKRGRPGIRLMRELLGDRGPSYRPPESGVEFRFRELCRRHMLGEFDLQVDVGDEDGWIGRVDFSHRSLLWIVEVDTALYHGSLSDRRRDDERRIRLEAMGIVVSRVTDVDLFHRPAETLARLSVDRRRASHRLSILAG